MSFTIPVIVMIAVFAILGIYPFGRLTIMTGDTTYQLVDYLSYYKTIIFGNNDFSYSLSKNMGGEMAGFAAYYLFSPLNLLTLPFSREYLFAGIGLIIILTPGLAALSMYHALTKLKEDDGGAVIFAVCYGLCAYVVVYNELLYYYTNIILLPLIILMLRKMIKEEKKICPGYVLLLSFAIINNYYTGYMICLFLLVYAVYILFCEVEGVRKLPLFIRFAGNSLLSVGISAATLLPALLSLSGEKDNLSVGLFLTFPPLDYFSKLYTGSFAGDFGTGRPNIYCGIIVTYLIAMVLTDKGLELKKRLATGFVLLFFWADFCINTMNVFWHGLNQPIGFPYRQAFALTAFCIITVYEKSRLSAKADNRKNLIFAAVFILYSIYVLMKHIDNTDMISVAVTSAVLAAVIICFYLPEKFRITLLLTVTTADLMFNAYQTLSHFYPDSVEEYQEPLGVISDAAETIKALGDDDVYRMEKLFRRTNNDALMLDYAGLTHFSSSEKKATMKFMGDLGFRNNGNWAMYTGNNTALADSLLGVKYIASQFDSAGKPYSLEYTDEEERYYVFRNRFATSIMKAVDDDVFSVSFTDDPFENQNRLADAITGNKEDILMLQEAKREDLADGSVRFEVTIKDAGLCYCYFTAPTLQDTKLYVNGEEWADYFRTFDWTALDLHKREAEEKITIDLISESGKKVEVDAGYFAVTNNDRLADWSDRVNRDGFALYKKTSSSYKGVYETDKDVLLFTLPCDKGWHLYVDGTEYGLEEAGGHLMASRVPTGKHEISLRFVSPGKRAGFVISILSLLILLLYCVPKKIIPLHFDTFSRHKVLREINRNKV